MTSAELEDAKTMLLESVALLPADIRPMVRVGGDRNILDVDWYLYLSVEHGGRCGNIIDDGSRPAGSDGSLRDVSAEALAARLEGLIRRWLAKHEVNRG